MNGIPFSSLPPEVQKQIDPTAKVAIKRKSHTTAWKDVPASWGQCRDHGMAWFPVEAGCVFCEEDQEPRETGGGGIRPRGSGPNATRDSEDAALEEE
jgi:hypothetical protein